MTISELVWGYNGSHSLVSMQLSAASQQFMYVIGRHCTHYIINSSNMPTIPNFAKDLKPSNINLLQSHLPNSFYHLNTPTTKGKMKLLKDFI